uniref:RHS repeat-associated core domain-containing protein n=1 Tax=Pseudescherichia sp. TaxID=2055881 RepID=UPI00289D850F
YYPFGGTAVWTARNEVEAGYKTVRYSGKERDGSGLYYYGHRYYAPWLCRWVSADPAGEVDGLNLFRMVRNNPVTFFDAKGNETTSHALFHDATKLSSISMLGSHDAGTYAFSRRRNGILSSLGSLLPWAFKTQNKTLLEQAKAGARYFDIRIALRKDGSYGFFHGPSVAAGDAIADIRALLEYAKNDKDNFYLLKIRFQSDKRPDNINNTPADNFLLSELAPCRENLIRPEDIAQDPSDNPGLGDATVSLLSEGKNIAIMTDHYTGEHSSWNYKEQVHTKWANRADVKKTGAFLEGFHNQPGPQNKITIIQTNMPVASINKGLVTRGVGNYLSRVKDRLATFVDRINSPGVISADYIGSKKGATAAFNRKIERNNEHLIQMHTRL